MEGRTFDYLLTRFTEPNELFGPFDIRRLREGELVTNTEGMLPEASLVFLDELLNANSAILNSLLMALNERIFRRGRETRPLSALMAEYQRYAASGEINFRVDDAAACGSAVLAGVADRTVSIDELDGVTVDLGDSAWFNLRTSNTEPLLRLNVEARSAAEVDAIVDRVADEVTARSGAGA
jgi:phosphomannomutase